MAETPLWIPAPDAWQRSQIGRFAAMLQLRHGVAFADYDDLWRWSVDNLEKFWEAVWDHFGIDSKTDRGRTLSSRAVPGATWFDTATPNYAEHALRGDWTHPAIIGVSQTRPDVEWPMHDLRDKVARCRAGLQRLGVGRGDRVVACLPNIPEAIAAFLATASLGAIWSSCPPEFGTRSVIDRFRQIEPKVLIAADGYVYGDKRINAMDKVTTIAAALPSLRATVLLPYLDPAAPAGWTGETWQDFTSQAGALKFEPVGFAHPLYILYSSGTTGLPKPIVHGHGGILIEHFKNLALHLDIAPGDRFFWFTTTGWMMWNLLTSGLLVGATVVTFDGNPAWPDAGTLWRLVADRRVTYAGVSASFLVACQNAGMRPATLGSFAALRGLGSTGSPLPPATARWISAEMGPAVQLGSGSGGTDICSAFVGAVPLKPVLADEISCRYLGARVEAYDPEGNSIVGAMGELVITAPLPSMPVGFWGDTDGSRYQNSYFDRYPGVWRHGDWITIRDSGGCTIHGRSDATLNRGGVRLGTAEYYALVDSLPAVAESLVVHIEDAANGMGELILFVVPRDAAAAGPDLIDTLRNAIRRELSPRHLPDIIHYVPSVPKTLSGKKLEVPVKRILSGATAASVATDDALANPGSLDAYIAFARQRAGS